MKRTHKLLLNGNEAVVHGALLAGCECFFGYPITPASEIAHAAARLFPKLGRTFLQSECETGAINMVMGAAAAGRRVMTASSGLGISLMQEGISYLACMELPSLIVDITRGGPGLGNIAPEQADYFQVVKGGGHGSYRCPVLAPASVQDMCDFAGLGFELAERYRTPVYVMTDAVVGQMMESLTLPEPVPGRRPLPEWALAPGLPRENFVSSIYLEPEQLEAVNHHLQNKYRQIEAAEQRCAETMMDGAEVVLVAYGIASRLATSAAAKLRRIGMNVGVLRPITLFPFPQAAMQQAAKKAKVFISVELSSGQMMEDIRLAVGDSAPVKLINRMGGMIPSIEEIVARTREIVGSLTS